MSESTNENAGESRSGQSPQVGDAGRVAGPCCVCGATNYPLSIGGPSICPACDCGIQLAPSLRATIAAQQQEIARLKSGRSMNGTARGRAYETEREWIVCGTPDEHEGLDENDPRHHNCDAMGCGQDHVLARWPKSGLVNATLERAATAIDTIAAHIRDEAHALPMGARSGRKTFLAQCPAYDVEKFRAELVEDVAAAIRALKTTEGA